MVNSSEGGEKKGRRVAAVGDKRWKGNSEKAQDVGSDAAHQKDKPTEAVTLSRGSVRGT